MRPDAAHRAMSDRRVFQAVDDFARLGGGVEMRHDDPERAIVEGTRRDRIFAVRDTRDRRDAGVERGGPDLGAGLKRHNPVLHVEEEPVEAGDRHRLGDLDAAGHADADAERQLSLFELLPGDVADGTHRWLPSRGGAVGKVAALEQFDKPNPKPSSRLSAGTTVTVTVVMRCC